MVNWGCCWSSILLAWGMVWCRVRQVWRNKEIVYGLGWQWMVKIFTWTPVGKDLHRCWIWSKDTIIGGQMGISKQSYYVFPTSMSWSYNFISILCANHFDRDPFLMSMEINVQKLNSDLTINRSSVPCILHTVIYFQPYFKRRDLIVDTFCKGSNGQCLVSSCSNI